MGRLFADTYADWYSLYGFLFWLDYLLAKRAELVSREVIASGSFQIMLEFLSKILALLFYFIIFYWIGVLNYQIAQYCVIVLLLIPKLVLVLGFNVINQLERKIQMKPND